MQVPASAKRSLYATGMGIFHCFYLREGSGEEEGIKREGKNLGKTKIPTRRPCLRSVRKFEDTVLIVKIEDEAPKENGS